MTLHHVHKGMHAWSAGRLSRGDDSMAELRCYSGNELCAHLSSLFFVITDSPKTPDNNQQRQQSTAHTRQHHAQTTTHSTTTQTTVENPTHTKRMMIANSPLPMFHEVPAFSDHEDSRQSIANEIPRPEAKGKSSRAHR